MTSAGESGSIAWHIAIECIASIRAPGDRYHTPGLKLQHTMLFTHAHCNILPGQLPLERQCRRHSSLGLCLAGAQGIGKVYSPHLLHSVMRQGLCSRRRSASRQKWSCAHQLTYTRLDRLSGTIREHIKFRFLKSPSNHTLKSGAIRYETPLCSCTSFRALHARLEKAIFYERGTLNRLRVTCMPSYVPSYITALKRRIC